MISTVLVLHTGGTIGMRPSSGGHRPMAGFDELLLQTLHDRNRTGLPNLAIVELDALIDRDARLDVVDNDGVSPLQWARRQGNDEVVAILEAAGAS